MWQAYSLGSIICNCLEEITDKRAMNTAQRLDADVATFIRVALYCLLVVPVTALLGQPLSWYISPGIVAIGLASTLMSSAYTVVLKRVNITTVAVLGYVAPILFLLIDRTSGETITATQTFAIFGLVTGGIGFALDDRLRIDRVAILAMALMLVYGGVEFYYAKWMFKHEGLNVISLFANVWGWAAIFLGIGIIARRKWRLLLTRQALTYTKISAVAKTFDVLTSAAWGIGITLTTVAQFSAMEAFFPPIMLILALVVQMALKVDIGERFERRVIGRKALMATLLVVSGAFV
jgi:hypothetical protein